jgi:ribosome-binding protein aMBF1 (putative translation factor)
MILYQCDLCGQVRACTPKEIEKREYDVCGECWAALSQKLAGKGRSRKARDTVFLPPPEIEHSSREDQPFPGQPPEIIGGSGHFV